MRLWDTGSMGSRIRAAVARLRSHLHPDDLVPDLESLLAFGTVLPRLQSVPSWTEMLANGPKGGQEALGMAGRLEALHDSFPSARGLVRVFGAVVEIAALAMFHAREALALRGTVAAELHPEGTR